MTLPPSDPGSEAFATASDMKIEATIDGGVRSAVSHGPAPGSLDRSFVRGIAWQGGVKWMVQLVTWATTIVVARILSPADYGLLSMSNVLLTFITLLSESGLGITVVRTRAITDEQVAQINSAAVLMGVACFAIACLVAVPVGRFYRAPELPAVIVAMSFALVVAGFRVVSGALLQRDLRFPRLAVIDGMQGLIQAFATLILAKLGFRYWSLVLGSLFGASIGTAVTVATRPYKFSWPRRETLRPVFTFTREVLGARLLWYIYQDSDFVVAGRRLGRQALGVYSYAWTLASLPVDKITAMVGTVTSPVFAAVQDDHVALRRYFLTVTEGLATLTFPLTIGIALVASELVPVILGPKWTAVTLPLQALAAYASIRTITPIAGHALVVLGETKFGVRLGIVDAIGLPTAFYIGSHWGTTGIAIAWAIAHPILVYIPSSIWLFRRLEVSWSSYVRALWPAISGCLVMTVAVPLVRMVVPTGLATGLRLALEVLAGATAYAACLFLFHRARVDKVWALWRHRAA